MTSTIYDGRLGQYAAIATLDPHQAADRLSGRQRRALSITAAADPQATRLHWSGIIGTEGELTGDGRIIELGALEWGELPIPLRHVTSDVGGHDGAVTVGRILSIERGENGQILATGDFDTSEYAVEAARQVSDGVQTGISMDLDNVSFEVRVAKDVFDEFIAAGQSDPPEPTTDEDGRVTVSEISSDDEVMVTTSARIRAATIVAIPAFASARIAMSSQPDVLDTDSDEEGGLVAGGFPVAPPRQWFDNPELDEPTAVRVTEDGRVYGHLAIWGTCHVGFPNQCVQPPHSEQGYRYFETGSVLTSSGDEVPVGHITMDTVHAGKRLSANQTLAHYENTGRAIADVAAGEDAWGIWVAGALRPDVTDEQVRELRASPLSGDWRRVGTSLELVAALAVNVPGFPVPRPQGLVASGSMVSLVASGMLPSSDVDWRRRDELSAEDVAYLRRKAAQGRSEEARALSQRTAQIRARQMAQRISRLGKFMTESVERAQDQKGYTLKA